jgi:hypothetical protein
MWEHLKTGWGKDKGLIILRMGGSGKVSGKMICSTVSDATKLTTNWSKVFGYAELKKMKCVRLNWTWIGLWMTNLNRNSLE